MHRGCLPTLNALGTVFPAPRPLHVAPCPFPRSLLSHKTLPPNTITVGTPSLVRLKSKQARRGDLQIGHAILGVGAPEAVLVVVVALVVFGPKGLAQAARSFGQMMRAFTPTIRELAEVSTDLRSTLEQEIGLEEIQRDLRDAVNPDTLIDSSKKSALETTNAIDVDPDIEAKRAESAKLAWGTGGKDSSVAEGPAVEVSSEVTQEGTPVATQKGLTDMTTEELEAELKRRKAESETA